MTAQMMSEGGGVATARRWGAALCLATDEVAARAVLGRAFADIGFEAIAALRRDGSCKATMLWRSMGDRVVDADDPLTAANREVLAGLSPNVNRWIMRRNDVITHEDFLAVDRRSYRDLMQLPGAFGHAPWQTILSVPHRVGGICYSLGAASASDFESRCGDVGQVRYLAGVYFALQTACEPPAPERLRALSPVQVDILRWAAAGKAYRDIADIVGLSTRTVRYHLDQARDQYGFATVTQAIVQAAKDYDFDPLLGR